MSGFFKIFKTKTKKENVVVDQDDADMEPNLPARRCSISKSGRMKQKKFQRQQIPDESDYMAHNKTPHGKQSIYQNKNSMKKYHSCDELDNTITNKYNHSGSKEENLNVDDVLREMLNVANSRLETAL